MGDCKKTTLCCEDLNTNYNYYLDKDNSLSKQPFGHDHMNMLTYLEQVVEDVKILAPELIAEAQNHYSACLLHTLILYYNYITSEEVESYYIEDKNMLIEATTNMIPIQSYLLLHESRYNIDDLISGIENNVRGKAL